jgi:hypothetical protein
MDETDSLLYTTERSELREMLLGRTAVWQEMDSDE